MNRLPPAYKSCFLKGIFPLIVSALVLLSCHGRHESAPAADNTLRNSVLLAHRFSITHEHDYTRVTISNPWQGAENIDMTWFLVRRGERIPQGIDTTRIIFIPIRRIICMSTTHLAMISALNEQQTIVGMSGTQYVYSPLLRSRVDSGFVKDVGYEANLNKELIVNLMPDIVMIYGVGSESSGYVGKLQELGVKVIYNADYLETEPLAKAEWIKLFGALYDRNQMADSIFTNESESYLTIRKTISDRNLSRPGVLLGLPFKDTWFVSPGNSFISKLIDDAGGDYLWKESQSSVSMPLGLENVWMKAMNADYWLNIGTVTSKAEITAVDMRLSEIPCFRNGHLYNNNNRISPGGGNDFWESGSLYPHLILKDIAMILHPELYPGDALFYYRKIE